MNHAIYEYEMMICNSLDGFWIVDCNANILDVYDSYCRMTGYQRDELLTISISDVEDFESHDETTLHIL